MGGFGQKVQMLNFMVPSIVEKNQVIVLAKWAKFSSTIQTCIETLPFDYRDNQEKWYKIIASSHKG